MIHHPRLKLYTFFHHYYLILLTIIFGKFNKGDNLKLLQEKFCVLTNKKYSIPVPMARVGIFLLVKHFLKKGRNEVILSPYTVADVINMVIVAGGKPVFVDIDRKTCNIDESKINSLITEKTCLVMATHFYGKVCNFDKLRKICKNYNIPFIEDAAQALGAKYKNKMAGTFGSAGVYSFGMYKNINSFYGGIIVTDDKNIYESVNSSIIDWPRQSIFLYLKKVFSGIATDLVTSKFLYNLFFFKFFRWAFINDVSIINNKLKIDVNPKIKKKLPHDYKVRMSDLQARIVLKQIDNLDKNTIARIELAKVWFNGLKSIDQIILPKYTDDFSNMYWYFPIQYRSRKKLVRFILEQGFDISESYHRNCASLKCFKEYKKNCSNAQATADSLIYLPTYPGYPKSDAKRITVLIKKYFEK